jgi:hypothetical protein
MNHIFVLALDDFNLELLRGIRAAEQFRFHPLLDFADLVRAPHYPMADLLARAERQLREFPERIAGLICHWDFPSSTMAPVLRRRFGLIGPSLESVLRCEHKYWSRLLQRQVVPELVPGFCLVDPYADASLATLDIEPPFWLKPVRAHSSHLGFRIATESDFQHALHEIRQQLPRYAEPFNVILSCADLPAEIAAADGYHCIAEELLEADALCTLEGYVFQGRPRIYGVVDSVRYPQTGTMQSYRYPSNLPETVQERMCTAAATVMEHIGYDNGPFNMEFFYQSERGQVMLLEINARISKSHCLPFAMVEGASHHEVAVGLAVGREPQFPRGEGPFKYAAKFMLRHFADAQVDAVPGREQIRRLQQEVPGTAINIQVKEGDRLAQLRDQDSYSYEYAELFLGGNSPAELEEKWQRCRARLAFDFSAPPAYTEADNSLH